MSRHPPLVHHTEAWYRTYYFLKFPATCLFGITVTLASLWLMQYLIDTGEKSLVESPNMNLVDFVRTPEEQQVQTKQRRPKPPPLPDEPPPEMRMQTESVVVENAWSTNFQAPTGFDMEIGARSFSGDGEYLPILKVQPVYPRSALQRGQYGWVLLEFTVDQNGKVLDPVVLDNCVDTHHPGSEVHECFDSPGRIFDRPAVAAAEKFKYKPRIIDGAPIEVAGVRHIISFTLDEMM